MILIMVMWIVLILSVISFSLAASVRAELASSEQSFDSERAFFMAKGAAEVVYSAYEKNEPIPDDAPIRRENGEYVFAFDSGAVRVRFESNAGLIDLNAASDLVLGALFAALGVDEQTKNRLVDSILDWRDADDIPHLYGAEVSDYPENIPGNSQRPRNAPFQTVDELLFVRNMTPELFYGAFTVNAATGEYERVPGARELLTVNSGIGKVDVNEAKFEVLAVLPLMTRPIAERIVAERVRQRFADAADLVERVPELATSDSLAYLTTEGAAAPAMLIAKATIASSGVARTVRLLFKREEKTQILLYAPLLFRRTVEAKFDRWRFD
jgi:general secretion pathway protein K